MNILGLMSGTSLDGVDLALCTFAGLDSGLTYEIVQAETIKYPSDILNRLKVVMSLSANELVLLDYELGRYFGEISKQFLSENNLSADVIASHGHTVFHQPEKGMTHQIGHGSQIYAVSGVPVISDFRSVDVGLGGQGAPLVPIGDELLFSEYGYCLNLGGIANISYEENGVRKAMDVCPFNQVFNDLASRIGQDYDKGGEIARKGVLIPELLKQLEQLDFFRLSPPKSLGKEWVDEYYLSQLKNEYRIEDMMHTVLVHYCVELSNVLKENLSLNNKVLCTGGGVYNTFFVEEIRRVNPAFDFIIPSSQTIDFKEALLFAFLGWRRIKGAFNCKKEVTGAIKDSMGGALYGFLNF